MYTEKERIHLEQEQCNNVLNLVNAFAKALPEVIGEFQKVFDFTLWKSLIGEEKASKIFPDHVKLYKKYNNRYNQLG